VPRRARAAMRILHAGVPDGRARVARREPIADRVRGSHVALGEPLSVHRLPVHRRRGAARRGAHAGRTVTTRLFGERVARSEDRRLLTGRGRYTGDFEPAAAHAAFVRSDFAHARITGIDVAAAQAVPGVLDVFTYADLAE